MSIFDFLFPQQATALHLRRMAERQSRVARMNRMRQQDCHNALEERVDELDRDVGVLALVLASLLETADEKGAISRDEIKSKIQELDVLDGFRDGKLSASFLRKWAD